MSTRPFIPRCVVLVGAPHNRLPNTDTAAIELNTQAPLDRARELCEMIPYDQGESLQVRLSAESDPGAARLDRNTLLLGRVRVYYNRDGNVTLKVAL